MIDESTRAWLALALAARGRPAPWQALARSCGGAVETVSAGDSELASLGAGEKAVGELRKAWTQSSLRVAERCARLGIRIAAPGDADWPAQLAAIPDPPLALFWKGASPAAHPPALAIVGARRASEYGERTGARIAREAAAAGILVLSGLARGIDAAAHRGALGSGRTAAVLAGGLDRVYPGEHRSLAASIVDAGGFLLSEQPPGVRPLPRLFPYRNRLVTGLSAATVIVEATLRSGSLTSARHALDQGREVFAVPGPIDSPTSEGTNALIAEGASPLCRIDDLSGVGALHALLSQREPKAAELLNNRPRAASTEEAAILAAIRAGRATCDEIKDMTALDGTRVLALLTALELDGLVRREAHGRFRTLA